MNSQASSISLNIKSSTWTKDTNDLFDFDTKDIYISELRTNSPLYLANRDEKIEYVKLKNDLSKLNLKNKNLKIIAQASPAGDGTYDIVNAFQCPSLASFNRNNFERLWSVVGKNEDKVKDLLIKEVIEGDIIKLGRIRLKVDKVNIKQSKILETNLMNATLENLNYYSTQNIFIKNSANNLDKHQSAEPKNIYNLNLSITNDDLILEDKLTKSVEQAQCRICFGMDSNLADPLINPCKCSGSMMYIHFNCLKQCLDIRTTKKSTDNYLFYHWKSYECEVCLSEFPKYIKYKDFNYKLIEVSIPFDQYILFDYSIYDDDKKKAFRKGYIIVKFNEQNQITIGRTYNNSIRIKDISVSRHHCIFTKKDGKLLLEDKGSKFGTLLYICKPIKLNSLNYILNVSSGKTLFNFWLSKSWNLIGSLCSSWCCKTDQDYMLNLEGKEEDSQDKKNEIILNNSFEDYIIYMPTIIRRNQSSFII